MLILILFSKSCAYWFEIQADIMSTITNVVFITQVSALWHYLSYFFVGSGYVPTWKTKILHHKQSHIVYLNAVLLTNLEIFLHWYFPLIQWVGRIKNGSQSWNIFVQQVLVGFGLILSSPSWFLFSFSFCATTDTILMDIQSNYKISFAFSAFWN